MDEPYKRELVSVWLILVAASARRDPALALVLKLVGGARVGALLKLIEQALAGRLYAQLPPGQQEVIDQLAALDWNFPEPVMEGETVDG